MKAGDLGQKISLERIIEGSDELGQPLTEWLPIVNTWAAVEPLAGREYIAAAAIQSEVTTRVRLRYRPGITSADRVNHEGRVYNIVSVIDYRSDHRELVLMCRG